MTDTKTLDRLRELPFGIGEFAGPSRRWLDEFFRDSAWHQMKIEEYREGDTLVVRAELPGVDPDKDIQIEIVDDALLIMAEKTEKSDEAKGHLRRSEFRYGSMTRSVPIPRGVDVSKVSALFKDGVLEIRVVVPEESVPQHSRKVLVRRA
ncbi:MAG: Hsp20/alpha crystallin family protein [Acidimicrobiaceae bacterium]|nr:Hsp20/alpha crystallin family protein [Acidimicrobiaceae bacterium]